MNFINVNLEKTVVNKVDFPQNGLPEAALCGRSNVGKSSLINTLLGRKSLARISQSPGKTRTINFYNIENAMYLTDLPGYGYAKASKTEQAKWGKMMESYLANRKQLKAVVFLLDIRHPPSANDKLMRDFLRYYGVNMLVVATKADKIPRGKVPKHIGIIRKELELGENVKIIPTSAQSKQGREEVWEALFSACDVNPLRRGEE